ncbi:SRPBCC family protein [Conexibacter sp. SYSU D00693]|uniref:SRPBCC family protein n=1 Tax=Conexibacter sp. SYSU D00693 TaxID=2812560 RepID=UPI00196B6376|nr:SRPBCC family protein [Conexibacter sp. SYSU D00693]
MDHQHAEHIAATPDAVFQALADVRNLPHYVPQMTAAEPKGGDKVEVEARYDGHTQHGEAWFRADEESHSIEWGAGDGPYHGRMHVEADGDGSKLVLDLTTTHVQSHDDVKATLDAVRRLVESEV